MSETTEMAASIRKLVLKFNELEKAFEKLTEKVNKTDKLLHQSVTRLIFVTLNENAAIESSDILELQKLVSQIDDVEVKKSVKSAVMSKIEKILGQKNVFSYTSEMFDFIDALGFEKDQDESNLEELKSLLKLYFNNFMKIKSTDPSQSIASKTSFLKKITELTKPFSKRETMDLFNTCFTESGFEKLDTESAYMLVQTMLAITEEIVGSTEMFNDQYRMITNLWNTKFAEIHFSTEERRKKVSDQISRFFGTDLTDELVAKFLNDFHVDFEAVPMWQYEVYLGLVPVFVELSERLRDTDLICEDDRVVNIHERFGVVDQEEHASESLCIKKNPQVIWDFSRHNEDPNDSEDSWIDDHNQNERLFYDLSGTNCLSLAQKTGRRSIQSVRISDVQQDFYSAFENFCPTTSIQSRA